MEETVQVTGSVATFTVHPDAEKMATGFVNDSKRYSLKIEKMLLPLNGNHDFTQEFPVTVSDNTTGGIIVDSSLNGNGTPLDLNELIPNRSYTITEVKAAYELVTVEVVNALGSQVGVTQPVRTGEKSFSLTIDATHEGAKIIVKNEPSDKGNLSLEYVPHLNFGEMTIGSVGEALRSEDARYSIWDSRVQTGDWKLSVKASEMKIMLTNGKESILPYYPLRYSADGTTFATLTPDIPVLIKEGVTKKGQPQQTEHWPASEMSGITFQSRNELTYSGDYRSVLTWTLESTP